MRDSSSSLEQASDAQRSLVDERTLAAVQSNTMGSLDSSEDSNADPMSITEAGGGWHWSEPEEDPARIGEYLVLHRLGEGGMGIIFAAYDERLDRKVALKLLRSASAHRPRLVREAKALARLSHPNVVQVYEIGDYGGAPFISMEFVDGVTLGEWLAAEPRSRAQVLEVFTQAGRGLAAAHAKRLIHRDFKPANVMVRADGRVIVMDFGLARGRDDEGAQQDADEPEDETSAGPSSRLLHSDLTMTGAMMGTPAYMAPEQFLGTRTGPHTDQFSFCVALWHALHGERPFAGDNVAALSLAVTRGELQPPARREVPNWLSRALQRGLSVMPEQRWPSMDALLDALAADPSRRWRMLGAGLGLAGLLAGALLASQLAEQRERSELEQSCAEEAAAIDADWSEQVREQARAAFTATGLIYADESFEHAATWMDRYASEWSERRASSCRARVGLEQTSPALDAATHAATRACLDEQRAAFVELANSWTEIGEHGVSRAVRAASDLPLLAQCEDPRWLRQRQRPPEDPELAARVDELRTQLGRATALSAATQHQQALETLQQTLPAARELGWDPLTAELLRASGSQLVLLGEFDEARQHFEESFVTAGRAGDDLGALSAASRMTGLLGMTLAEYEEGKHWARLGEMLLDRMDLRGSAQEATILNPLGAIQASTGEPEAALISFGRALEIWEGQMGPNNPPAATALGNLAVVHMMVDDLDQAIAAQERALSIREATLGRIHPDVAHSLFNLGLAVEKQGDRARALELYGRALELREIIHGAEHPEVAAIVHAIGLCHQKAEAFEAAQTSFERALALTTASLPPDHPEHIDAIISLTEVELELGRVDRAAPRIELLLATAVGEQADKLGKRRVGKIQVSAAKLALARGELDQAREFADLARANYERAELPELIEKLDAWIAELP